MQSSTAVGSGYDEVLRAMSLPDEPLFTTDADYLWSVYLGSFLDPDDRQYHNCSACRKFIERFGGLVTIDPETGKTTSAVWKVVGNQYEYTLRVMKQAVEESRVTGVFLSSDKVLGTPVTGEWTHFSVKNPRIHKNPCLNAFQVASKKKSDYQNVSRALGEFDTRILSQVVEMLRGDALYRSEKVLGPAKWLLELGRKVDRLGHRWHFDNVVWRAIASAPDGFCHPRSSMIGTLLDDLMGDRCLCEICGEECEDNLCEDCYLDETNECMICGERFEDEDTSDFILAKAELSSTGKRPPGIYRVTSRPFMVQPMLGDGWLTPSRIRFVDKLPSPSSEYEISGHICNGCAEPYRLTHDKIYGGDDSWDRERQYTRDVILSNRDMLRDLECDSTTEGADGKYLTYSSAKDWEDIQDTYQLPDLPTYHEWIFIEHAGIKVFRTCQSYSSSDPGWLSLSPEPRFRSGAGRLFPETFAPSGLPTYESFDWNDSRYYEGARRAREAIVKSIDRGFLRQDGIFDASGTPIICG